MFIRALGRGAANRISDTGTGLKLRWTSEPSITLLEQKSCLHTTCVSLVYTWWTLFSLFWNVPLWLEGTATFLWIEVAWRGEDGPSFEHTGKGRLRKKVPQQDCQSGLLTACSLGYHAQFGGKMTSATVLGVQEPGQWLSNLGWSTFRWGQGPHIPYSWLIPTFQ